jgi:transposase InsO family protein
LGVKTAFTDWKSMGERHNKNFSGKLRDELLNGEVFCTLAEAEVLFDVWRRQYNTVRPHSAFGYKLSVPETIAPPNRFASWSPSDSAKPPASHRAGGTDPQA